MLASVRPTRRFRISRSARCPWPFAGWKRSVAVGYMFPEASTYEQRISVTTYGHEIGLSQADYDSAVDWGLQQMERATLAERDYAALRADFEAMAGDLADARATLAVIAAVMAQSVVGE